MSDRVVVNLVTGEPAEWADRCPEHPVGTTYARDHRYEQRECSVRGCTWGILSYERGLLFEHISDGETPLGEDHGPTGYGWALWDTDGSRAAIHVRRDPAR